MQARGLQRGVKPYEVYLRPHNYSILAGVALSCLVPNRMRQPVESFVVQADLGNAGLINIGDSTTSLTNGLQLDAGHAWLFSVTSPILPSLLSETPLTYEQAAQIMQNEMALIARYGRTNHRRLVIDMADYFVIADDAAQRLRVFWSMQTE